MKKKTPSSVSALPGMGKTLADSSNATYQQNNQPDNDPWDACNASQAMGTKLKAAATRLGFTQSLRDGWVRQCPHCGKQVGLFARDGAIDVWSWDSPSCSAIPAIFRWLRDQGFQPKGGEA